LVTTGEPGDTTEESQLVALAELIHINPPAEMATVTITEPVHERIVHSKGNYHINPQMGHVDGIAQVNLEDEAALW